MFTVHNAWLQKQHVLTREKLQTNVSKLHSVPALPLVSTAPGHSVQAALSDTWQFEFQILPELRSSPCRLRVLEGTYFFLE